MADGADRLAITPLLPHLGARVDGVDLARPVDDDTFARIEAAFEEHQVLVFPGQRLTDEQQMAFSRRFGPLETTIAATGRENRVHRNMVDLTNVDPDHD